MSKHLSRVTLSRLEARREASAVTNTDTLLCACTIPGHMRAVAAVMAAAGEERVGNVVLPADEVVHGDDADCRAPGGESADDYTSDVAHGDYPPPAAVPPVTHALWCADPNGGVLVRAATSGIPRQAIGEPQGTNSTVQGPVRTPRSSQRFNTSISLSGMAASQPSDPRHGTPHTSINAPSTSPINCLCVAGEARIWAGLADGTVQVYDAASMRLVDEFKAHGTVIHAMICVSMPSDNAAMEHHMPVVLTASADWSIGKWDAGTGRALGRLQGHNNSVKCLAASSMGEFLLSGGDDGCIRLWMLTQNKELTHASKALWPSGATGEGSQPKYSRSSTAHTTAPTMSCRFPMLAHGGQAVTGIVLVGDEYFVTVGADGTAQACSLGGLIPQANNSSAAGDTDLVIGSWIKEVEARPCALTSVMHDAASRRLWISGVDGVITVHDDASPGFTRLAALHDHSGAYVHLMLPLAPRGVEVAHAVWTLDAEGRLFRYSESITGSAQLLEDVARGGSCQDLSMIYEPTAQNPNAYAGAPLLAEKEVAGMEACRELGTLIDELREAAVGNYNQLQKCRHELTEAEKRAERVRMGLSIAMSGIGNEPGKLTSGTGFAPLTGRYLFLARKWLHMQREQGRQRRLASLMAISARRTLARSYYIAWTQFTREQSEERAKRDFSGLMQETRNRLYVQRAMMQMLEVSHRHRAWSAQIRAVWYLHASLAHSLRRQYWWRWIQALRHGKLVCQRQRLVGAVVRASNEQMVLRHWLKLRAAGASQAQLGNKLAMLLHFNRERVSLLRSESLRRWAMWARGRHKHHLLQKKHQELELGLSAEAPPTWPLRLAQRYLQHWLTWRQLRASEKAGAVLRESEVSLANWYALLEGAKEADPEQDDVDLLAARRGLAEGEELELAQRERLIAAERATARLELEIMARPFFTNIESGNLITVQLDAVIALLRARALNGLVDIMAIKEGRALFEATLSTYLTGSKPACKPSVSEVGISGKPPQGHASRLARDGRAAASGHSLHPFAAALQRLRRALVAAVMATGHEPLEEHAVPPIEVTISGSNRTVVIPDWGLKQEWIRLIKGQAGATAVMALKHLIVAYDGCGQHMKQLTNRYGTLASEAAGKTKPSSKRPAANEKPHDTAAIFRAECRHGVPEPLMLELLANAPLLLPLLAPGAQRAAMEYMPEPEHLAWREAYTDPFVQPPPATFTEPQPLHLEGERPASAVAPPGPTLDHDDESIDPLPKAPAPTRRSPPRRPAPSPGKTGGSRTASPATGPRKATSHHPASATGTAPTPIRRAGSPGQAARAERSNANPAHPPEAQASAASMPPVDADVKPFLGMKLLAVRGTDRARTSIILSDIVATYSPGGDGTEEAGPAAAAGLKEGDVLLQFAGSSVPDMKAFSTLAARHAMPGAMIKLVILRQGSRQQVSIRVGWKRAT